MPRYNGISEGTYSKIIIDSGQLRIGYVDEENPGALIGATRGGSIFEITSDIRSMPVDGIKGDIKGDKRITCVTAILTVNILEFKSWVIKLAAPGSNNYDYPEVSPTHAEIKRFLLLSLAKYQSSIALIGDIKDSDEQIICILKNIIGTNGINISFAENDESVMQIIFKAHFDPKIMDSEPWEILIPGVFVDFKYEYLGDNKVLFTPLINSPWPIDEYDWDFGDGSEHSNEESPTHDYTGAYDVIGFWKGENNTVDSVNGNNAVWNANPGYIAGVVGNAFNLTNSGYIEIPNNQNYNFGSSGKFSFSFYFFNSSFSEAWFGLRTPAGLFAGWSIRLKYGSSNVRICQGNSGGGDTAQQRYGVALSDNTWHKIYVTYDGTSSTAKWELYVDDVLWIPTYRSNFFWPNDIGVNVLRMTSVSPGSQRYDEVKIIDESTLWPKTVTLRVKIKGEYYSKTKEVSF
jgi:hypothetical protein